MMTYCSSPPLFRFASLLQANVCFHLEGAKRSQIVPRPLESARDSFSAALCLDRPSKRSRNQVLETHGNETLRRAVFQTLLLLLAHSQVSVRRSGTLQSLVRLGH